MPALNKMFALHAKMAGLFQILLRHVNVLIPLTPPPPLSMQMATVFNAGLTKSSMEDSVKTVPNTAIAALFKQVQETLHFAHNALQASFLVEEHVLAPLIKY
jgi:hypothetical protein